MIRVVYAASGHALEPRVYYRTSKEAQRSAGTKFGKDWRERGLALAPAAPAPRREPARPGPDHPALQPLLPFRAWSVPIGGYP